MSDTKLLVAVFVALLAQSAMALEGGKPEAADTTEAKSVAWYVANMPEARKKNRECYQDPSAKDLQASSGCVNSLQALKLSFAGGNQPVSKH